MIMRVGSPRARWALVAFLVIKKVMITFRLLCTNNYQLSELVISAVLNNRSILLPEQHTANQSPPLLLWLNGSWKFSNIVIIFSSEKGFHPIPLGVWGRREKERKKRKEKGRDCGKSSTFSLPYIDFTACGCVKLLRCNPQIVFLIRK
jgi:hypothetical protein